MNWNFTTDISTHLRGQKKDCFNRKKKRYTHTHTISLGCEAENAGYFAFFIYTYIPVYLFIKCATRTRTRAEVRICVVCMIVVFEKEKREMCQMRSCIYFFFADASTLASTWVTFPSMTTPFPSIKATRERPSQFL